MADYRTKLQSASRAWLPAILAAYIILQPVLDILTAMGVNAEHPVTAGVVVRALFMAMGFLYAVFVCDFRGKRLPMVYAGVLIAYLALFMVRMLAVGGISLCFSNLTEVVKTFFAPFVLIFLYCVYRQYGFSVTTKSIGAAGGIYTSVILLAYLTNTSNSSYANSGHGYNGWFYAANEVGCIIALTAPFAVYHCIEMIPGITKKTWWKIPVIAWCLLSVAFSANFVGTKIIFMFCLVYALASLVWLLFRLYQERSAAVLLQIAAPLFLVVCILVFYKFSALKGYIDGTYSDVFNVPSDELVTWWPSQLQGAAKGTWLAGVIRENRLVEWVDKVLSRRLYSAAPSLQVFLDGGISAKLLGIGYANTDAYDRYIHFMIEMDPPAILIRHGIIGFAVYCVPYFAFILYAVIQFFKRPLQRLSSLSYCTLLYSTLAGFAISFVAGHALVSPAVATFVLVTGMQFWVHTQEQNKLPRDGKAR